ncbi:MAG: ATP-binding cassette domain-containing protein [Planctomycetota bacterium]|nr:MAG: ATP-binding cassette domain-containing protein [Planctomycetota bacterium]
MNRHADPSQPPLLEVQDLAVEYPLRGGRRLRAVDGVSFQLQTGKTIGIVGESGCGKSTTARALIGLIEPSAGRIAYHGKDIIGLGRQGWRQLRRQVQMVFQDPYASLNPRMSVGDIIDEPLRNYRIGNRESRRQRVRELLDLVGLDATSLRRFPHEFSGGQRQRIGIARALALEPQALICDEPVSALDVSVQAQIINLLIDLRQRLGLSLIIIAHDLAVVRHLADEILVMYLGQVAESGPAQRLMAQPQHPYTQALLASIPIPDPALARNQRRIPAPGEVGSLELRQSGCPFAPRCPQRMERCQSPPPRLGEDGHQAACWLLHKDKDTPASGS